MGPCKRSFDNDDGIDWVCYRICGDYRRVINSQHLSKHDTDRETYTEEYHLTTDELIAKAFRVIQSSRRGYYPNGETDLIALVIKNVYKRDRRTLIGASASRQGWASWFRHGTLQSDKITTLGKRE